MQQALQEHASGEWCKQGEFGLASPCPLLHWECFPKKRGKDKVRQKSSLVDYVTGGKG